MRLFGYLLVFIHSFLLLWAVGGAIEMTPLEVPWIPYTNLDFPKWLLPIHWGSVIIASVGFLLGYFSRWRSLPNYMLAAYTMLFTLCVIETFGFMTSSTRYIAMVSELVAYTAILALLYRSEYFKEYFGGENESRLV